MIFQKNQKKGFTLIEMLVTVALFVAVITTASGIFVSSIKAQRRSLASQQLLDQTSYALEYISRALRMAKKELAAPSCLSGNGLNYQETHAGKGIKFINYNDECQEFFWDTNTDRLKEKKGTEEFFLTSEDLEVDYFNIELTGASQNDDFQPKITISLKITGQEQSQIKIQSTVSQRNLDVWQ